MHPAKSVALLAGLGALALGLTSCGAGTASSDSGGTATVQVVASTDVWGSIAESVGGDSVEVTSLISSPDADPHSYESNVRNVLAVKQADVVIANGGGYDDFMDRLIEASNTSATVLTAVDISGKVARDGAELNEHVWYDLSTAELVATQIADALSTANPANTRIYHANAQAFNADVDTLMGRERAMKAQFGGLSVGITEPVPLYLLEAIGLVNRTPPDFTEAVEAGEDVSVAVLDQTLKLYSDHEVVALVYNEQTDGAVTEQVKTAATDAGVPVVGVTETLPTGDDYATWMSDNLTRIAKALRQG